jgi:sigma-B regulation protein RsbU (phosphoserine phosphatase)
MPRKMLARTLQQWGYEVAAAADGAQAWDLFQADSFGMIISDWMMPNLDGVQLCQRVREMQGRPYTYVILLTSRSDRESLVEALAAGADDFVAKPFDEQELHARIRSGERILELSHELARQMEEMARANKVIKQINTQMTRDMHELTRSLDRWMRQPPGEGAGNLHPELRASVKEELRGELLGILDQWMTALAAGDGKPGS